ncbi:hypothetical protein [Caenispirillum bisanense]|uniref:hypothetical protein n=1 Tax=Caenispirillum bisanense TaxID=414052 RepID=UPI0031E1DC26
MTIRRALWVAAVAVVLQGCGPVYTTHYDYTAPATPEGKACAAQCQVSQTHCRSSCESAQDACRARARLEAVQEYERYAEARTQAGKKIDRSVSSFDRSYSCSSQTCRPGCDDDFRICYSTCGGQVRATVVCTSGCE